MTLRASRTERASSFNTVKARIITVKKNYNAMLVSSRTRAKYERIFCFWTNYPNFYTFCVIFPGLFSRCRWMNNKFYSQAVTMTFLAIWHGFHSGYYLTFFNEILVMQFEKTFIPACQKNPTLSKLWQENIIAKILFIVIGKVQITEFIKKVNLLIGSSSWCQLLYIYMGQRLGSCPSCMQRQ